MKTGKHERRAGARFSFLLRQLEEEGWSQTAIAEAIGCHQTLISKWWWRGEVPHDLTRKGLRDDVITGIYVGLHVRADFLVMPRPKGYPSTIKLPNGESRPASEDELDHRDFKVVTNAELEAARDKKERATMRADINELKSTAADVKELKEQMAQLLALLARDAKAGR